MKIEMKQICQKLSMMVLALMISTSVIAYDCEVDGIYYNRISSTELEVAKSVEGYGKGLYKGMISIPSNVSFNGKSFKVKAIGEYAFFWCDNLVSVNIPNTVTIIKRRAFTDCTNLESISMSNNITTIEEYAFDDCRSLKSISLPDCLTSVGEFAFFQCKSLQTIRIPNSITKINESTFSGCSSLKTVTLPKNLQTIEKSAFAACTSLTSITIPKTVSKIWVYAFKDCSSLTSINIPEGITEMREGVFQNCSSLTSIVIPNSATIIFSHCFEGCASLGTLTIGEKLELISGGAFKGADALTSIYLRCSIPPTNNSKKDDDPFDRACYAWADVYVPRGTKETYQNARYWKNFYSISEYNYTDVDRVNNDGREESRYTLDGQKVLEPKRGINIIKMNDGTTRKVVVK